MYGSLHLCSHSSSTPCIHRHRLQRCREVPRRPSAAAAATAPRVGQSLDQSAFETVTSIVQQHGLDKDASLVAQEAGLAFNYLQAAGCLPSSLQEATQLVQHALELSDLLATGSTFRTLQMVKRHPDLLSIPPDEVAGKVLQLKMLMPTANIADLLYQKPTLLLLDDIPGTLGPALNKLHALMPGIPVDKKLHEGGTVFWSFVSLLEASSRQAASASAEATPGSSIL